MKLANDCLFDPDPTQKSAAFELDALVLNLIIVSPDDQVDPSPFSTAERKFGNPAELHILLSKPFIPKADLYRKPPACLAFVCGILFLFQGTPSGLWLTHELEPIFGVEEELAAASPDRIYDQIEAALASPAFGPRSLLESINIEILATTDSA